MLRLNIVFTLIISSAVLYAQKDSSDASNGGGGFLTIDGKNILFSEAGVELNSSHYRIPGEVNKIIHAIFKSKDLKLPVQIKQLILTNIYSPEITYRRVSVIDPQKFDSIKKRYKRASKNKDDLDWDRFQIYATTGQSNKTKWATDLYDSFIDLDDRRKAKKLIHEALFRISFKAPIELVVQIERNIFTQVDNPQQITKVFELYEGLFKAEIIDLHTMLTMYIEYLDHYKSTKLQLEDISSPKKIGHLISINLNSRDLNKKYAGQEAVLEIPPPKFYDGRFTYYKGPFCSDIQKLTGLNLEHEGLLDIFRYFKTYSLKLIQKLSGDYSAIPLEIVTRYQCGPHQRFLNQYFSSSNSIIKFKTPFVGYGWNTSPYNKLVYIHTTLSPRELKKECRGKQSIEVRAHATDVKLNLFLEACEKLIERNGGIGP